ncbi:MAG: L-fucose/L-arabinose isomerase family protein [Christensenellales bacterium]|jgi:L-fucose isomerase-like protein
MNIPQVKLGIVAVSRDCFPMSLSERRRNSVVEAFSGSHGEIFKAETIIENETHSLKALKEINDAGVNALVVYLGNFGPEGPETILAQRFQGPVMFVAASEESIDVLSNDRGDAFCGMLNASYNLKLRNIKAYIPEYPVGTPAEVADMIAEFIPVARVLIGLKGLKIFGFGPRPYDFLACNAPIKSLFDLGVEIQENSELDLFEYYNARLEDKRIPDIVADMEKELGAGNMHPGVLPRLAALELSLLDWKDANLGASKYAAFANKCWPAFQTQFKCVPCFVNSRLAARMMPVACETDIYGALTEYIICCASGKPPAILDINNTVPADLYESQIKGRHSFGPNEVFMGFHCGNVSSCYIKQPTMKHQLIMKRSLEPDSEPDITRGTLEGDIIPGDITFFRLQSGADTTLRSYIAQGEVLPADTFSFGGIGVFGIPEMNRFYRHVLIEKNYPHHGGVAFAKIGKTLWSAMKLLGIEDVSFNQPKGMLYKNENPFA